MSNDTAPVLDFFATTQLLKARPMTLAFPKGNNPHSMLFPGPQGVSIKWVRFERKAASIPFDPSLIYISTWGREKMKASKTA